MKVLIFPWFGLKLLVLVALDVLQLGTQLFPWWSAVSSTGLFALITTLFFLNPTRVVKLGLLPETVLSPTQQLALALEAVVSPALSITTIELSETNQTSQLTTLQAETEQLLTQQPTDRDVLLNSALLALWLQQPDQAETYLARARTVDPLHPFLPVLEAQVANFSQLQ